MKNKTVGNLLAFLTMAVWATTFISTKKLLETLSPIEIMIVRFILAFIMLSILFPGRLKMEKKQELLCALAGLTGVCAYYLLENYALYYTQAANVSVVICAAPFFTAVLATLLGQKGLLNVGFCAGFVFAAVGVALMSFSSAQQLQINPVGDMLAVACALMWAVYSLLAEKIGTFGYSNGQISRKLFFYGTIFSLPLCLTCDFATLPARLASFSSIAHILYLGCIASAICYVTWNMSIDRIGPVRAGVYLYLQPALTIAVSVTVLSETITLRAGIGIFFVLLGLFISEYGKKTYQLLRKHYHAN